jgi:hypothetical protein
MPPAIPLAAGGAALALGAPPRARARSTSRCHPGGAHRAAPGLCSARRCAPVRSGAREGFTAEVAPQTPPSGGTSLDATARTVKRLRAELPFPGGLAARELLADNVKYSFLSPLVQLSGRDAYDKAMLLWRKEVPTRLGDAFRVRRRTRRRAQPCARRGPCALRRTACCTAPARLTGSPCAPCTTLPAPRAQYEAVRVFQPDARTLVVRWRIEWTARPLGFSQWPVLEEAAALEKAVAATQVRARRGAACPARKRARLVRAAGSQPARSPAAARAGPGAGGGSRARG